MIAFLILGAIDMLAGTSLFLLTDIYVVKLLALMLIAKGALSIFKNFFNY
jgi:hypothetical protein